MLVPVGSLMDAHACKQLVGGKGRDAPASCCMREANATSQLGVKASNTASMQNGLHDNMGITQVLPFMFAFLLAEQIAVRPVLQSLGNQKMRRSTPRGAQSGVDDGASMQVGTHLGCSAQTCPQCCRTHPNQTAPGSTRHRLLLSGG